ncbi:MAG TPA: cobalamin biosynthesis protein [Bradyrhizobium sp.]|nr:cobalamin biosynthesis protein [Bradyrhizobium sp.]
MRVAGLGFRKEATIESLRDALAAAGGARGLDALATAADKAGAAVIVSLACELGLTIRPVPAEVLARVETPTRSARIATMFGTGSLAEAAALAAAGQGARLVAERTVSRDRAATAAIAEGEGA